MLVIFAMALVNSSVAIYIIHNEVVCACVLCYHDHRVVVVCAPTIVSCMWMLPAGDAGNMICEMFAGTPRGP